MVIWTRPAKADLKHVHDFIAGDSKHYAKKVAQEIREKTDILDELPNVGKMVPEVGSAKSRSCTFILIGSCTKLTTSNAMCWR